MCVCVVFFRSLCYFYTYISFVFLCWKSPVCPFFCRMKVMLLGLPTLADKKRRERARREGPCKASYLDSFTLKPYTACMLAWGKGRKVGWMKISVVWGMLWPAWWKELVIAISFWPAWSGQGVAFLWPARWEDGKNWSLLFPSGLRGVDKGWCFSSTFTCWPPVVTRNTFLALPTSWWPWRSDFCQPVRQHGMSCSNSNFSCKLQRN